jgi:hypothetical protein
MLTAIGVMSVRCLVNETNRCTEFQLYWYYYSTCFGQPFCPSSGVLSGISALLCSSILLLVANCSSQLHKVYQSQYTAKNSWWWAERLPKTYRVVIPIKLEFSASVGFIHKESVMMHGHMILKKSVHLYIIQDSHLTTNKYSITNVQLFLNNIL